MTKTVFLSHSSEFARYPAGHSFVDAAMNAINAAGCVATDMRNFPAAEQNPAAACVDRVRQHDVYVGLIGFRYGSPVVDRPDVSYTELEFEAATAAHLPRLIFMLADDADITPAFVVDAEYAKRQHTFRDRLMRSGVVVRHFRSLAELEAQVERGLRELLAQPSTDAAGELVVSWTANGDELPQCEFIYFIPGCPFSACAPCLRNHGAQPVRVTRIELQPRLFRQFLEGKEVLGTEVLTECPLRFAAGERDETTGLAWKDGGPDRWVIDTPFTVSTKSEIELPQPELYCDEDDPTSLSELRDLIAVPTLGVEYIVTVVADQPPTSTTLSVPLRVLESLIEEGDGGIGLLVDRLGVDDEAERQRLRQAYERERQLDWQTRCAIAERLNRIEQRRVLEQADRDVALRPGDAQAHCRLGIALLEESRPEEALAALDRAIELGLDNSEVRLGRSQALRGLSRHDDALVEVDRVVTADAANARAQELRGQILLDLGRYDEALAAFDAALRLTPDSAHGHLGRGLALWLMESNDNAALKALDRAMSIDPEEPGLHIARASVLATLERDEEAIVAVRKRLLLGPLDMDRLRLIEGLLSEPGRIELRRLLGSFGLLESFDQLPAGDGGDSQPTTTRKVP